MEDILAGYEDKLPNRTTFEWTINVYKGLFPYKRNRFNDFQDEEKWEGLNIHKNDQRIIGDMGLKEVFQIEKLITFQLTLRLPLQNLGKSTKFKWERV
ncbi:hypothetical protein [Bacillus solimangrovi]|uniref:Uncharacterized protein n=1 Tax=Bacillus solimangrovi TaxID=1305675 RepID=A0A1E5LEB2_9BACI|nr:hypothetical protein [Bacillus solimangrovi]OEH92389.1 hypothetical protein BFG57_16240 [Bacillus solimangrovi]